MNSALYFKYNQNKIALFFMISDYALLLMETGNHFSDSIFKEHNINSSVINWSYGSSLVGVKYSNATFSLTLASLQNLSPFVVQDSLGKGKFGLYYDSLRSYYSGSVSSYSTYFGMSYLGSMPFGNMLLNF